jgi:hypothetical protein
VLGHVRVSTGLLAFEKTPGAHGGARWHTSTIGKALQGQDTAKHTPLER